MILLPVKALVTSSSKKKEKMKHRVAHAFHDVLGPTADDEARYVHAASVAHATPQYMKLFPGGIAAENSRRRLLQHFSRLLSFLPEVESSFFLVGVLSLLDALLECMMTPLRCILRVCLGQRVERRHWLSLWLIFTTWCVLEYLTLEYRLYALLYHNVRTTSVVKLYVLFGMLDVGDKLLASLLSDTCEVLQIHLIRVDNSSASFSPPGQNRNWKHFAAALIFGTVLCVMHAMVLLLHVVSINVAINGEHSLIAMMLSSNVLEIKAVVFKKFVPETLFQLACSDVVERMQYWVFVGIMVLQHAQSGLTPSRLQSQSGSSFLFRSVGDGLSRIFASAVSADAASARVASSPALGDSDSAFSDAVAGNGFVVEKSPTPFPSISSPQSIMGAIDTTDILLIFCFEVLIDSVKHLFVARFNRLSLSIYRSFYQMVLLDTAVERLLWRFRVAVFVEKRDGTVVLENGRLSDSDDDKSSAGRSTERARSGRDGDAKKKKKKKPEEESLLRRSVLLQPSNGFIRNPSRRIGFVPTAHAALVLWSALPFVVYLGRTDMTSLVLVVLCVVLSKLLVSTILSSMAWRFVIRTLLRRRRRHPDRLSGRTSRRMATKDSLREEDQEIEKTNGNSDQDQPWNTVTTPQAGGLLRKDTAPPGNIKEYQEGKKTSSGCSDGSGGTSRISPTTSLSMKRRIEGPPQLADMVADGASRFGSDKDGEGRPVQEVVSTPVRRDHHQLSNAPMQRQCSEEVARSLALEYCVYGISPAITPMRGDDTHVAPLLDLANPGGSFTPPAAVSISPRDGASPVSRSCSSRQSVRRDTAAANLFDRRRSGEHECVALHLPLDLCELLQVERFDLCAGKKSSS